MRILFNGNITTMNTAQPRATAIAMEGERILFTGSDEQVLAAAAPHSEKIDLKGKTVWPGLTDAHLHFEIYSASLQKIDCETSTLQECLDRVAQKVKTSRPGEWIFGHCWNQNVWAGGYPTAADLDAVAPHNPVYLTAKSLHASWANTAALNAAGISAATPDPENGIIQRDSAGRLTGILFELSAMRLLESTLPLPSLEQMTSSFQQAQASLWKMGLTGIHDYDTKQCFQALQLLRERDDLHLRVVKGVPQTEMAHAAAMGIRSGFGDDYLRIGSVKLFADGALGPQTAAMIQPYENSSYTGEIMLDSEQVFEIGQQAAASGLSIAIHAIGDRANHEIINGIAQLREYEKSHHLPHLRHRIEHVQLLHPSDLSRLAEYGIIASMQPIHATSDMDIADRYWGTRAAYSYAWKSLKNQNTILAFGSDAPVETPNPFWGIHAAVTRQRIGGYPSPEGWQSGQKLSLQEALEAYTTGPAYVCGQEKSLGQLAPGFLADLIVLDQDPFKQPVQDLYSIAPVATMVGGQWVWQA